MIDLTLLLEAPAPSNPFGGIVPIIVFIAIFYFILIRPQQKQRKAKEAMIAALKSGDKVVTTGGIHGLVQHVSDKAVKVKVAEGTVLEFDRNAIQSVIPKASKNTASEA